MFTILISNFFFFCLFVLKGNQINGNVDLRQATMRAVRVCMREKGMLFASPSAVKQGVGLHM